MALFKIKARKSVAIFLTCMKCYVASPSWSYDLLVLSLSMAFFTISMVKEVQVSGHGSGGSNKGALRGMMYSEAAYSTQVSEDMIVADVECS